MNQPAPRITTANLADPYSPAPDSETDQDAPAIRRYNISHKTRFSYSAPVKLDQLVLRLQPRTSALQQLRHFEMTVTPQPARHTHGIDLHGSIRHWLWFNQEHPELTIETRSTVDCLLHNPFDYIIVDPGILKLPARYAEPVRTASAHYRKREGLHPAVDAMARQIMAEADGDTVLFLTQLTAHLNQRITQTTRIEGDPFTPTQTLELGEAACRDTAVLFMDACRSVGLAARFVSGYAYDAREDDQRELHAWAEVYLPGGGWRGYDPTTGMAVANGHIAIAASPTASYAAPTAGTFRGPGVTSSLSYEISMTAESLAAAPQPDGVTYTWP